MIKDIKDLTSFKWATVTGIDPLAIKLDGDTAPLALIPDSLVDPATLAAGDRVRVELSLRKVVIHGRSNGTLPLGYPLLVDRVETLETSSETVSGSAVAWPGSGSSIMSQVLRKKNGRVTFNCNFTCSSVPGVGAVLFEIPSGFRPGMRSGGGSGLDNGGNIVQGLVDPNGQFRMYKIGNVSGNIVITGTWDVG